MSLPTHEATEKAEAEAEESVEIARVEESNELDRRMERDEAPIDRLVIEEKNREADMIFVANLKLKLWMQLRSTC